ncbi:hypothetical protein BDW66DRAFT_20136 [Aspergillus desertorum]
MAKQDPSSERAFQICQRLFCTIAGRSGFDLQGVASVLLAKQEASKLEDLDLGSLRPKSMKLQGCSADWDPDVMGSESDYGQDQVPFVDPALFSFEEGSLSLPVCHCCHISQVLLGKDQMLISLPRIRILKLSFKSRRTTLSRRANAVKKGPRVKENPSDHTDLSCRDMQ